MRLSLPRRGEIGPDRLSALDLSNLRVEEHGTSMHMAALMLLDGGPLLDEHVSVAASVRRPGETGVNRAGVRLATVPVNDPDATSRPETVAARTGAQRRRPPRQPNGRYVQRWMAHVMAYLPRQGWSTLSNSSASSGPRADEQVMHRKASLEQRGLRSRDS